MKKGWIIFWIVLIILIGVGIWWGYKQYKKWIGIWNDIHFSKPIPQSLDLKGLTPQDLLSSALTGKPIDVNADLKMFITNDSDTTVKFNNFRIQILYNGSLITQSSDKVYNTDYTLLKNSVLPVNDTVNINGNTAIDFLVQKATGKHPSLDYKVDINVNGVPVSKIYPIEGTFDW